MVPMVYVPPAIHAIYRSQRSKKTPSTIQAESSQQSYDGKNESSTSDTLNHEDGKNTSSPSDTLNREDGKNTSSPSNILNREDTWHHMRQQPVDSLLSKSYLKPQKIFLLALALSLIVRPCVASEDRNITCRGDVSFTSPNYPSNYPDNANKMWFITAPKGRRILVTFADFNIQEEDFLNLADKVNDQNFKRYTGEGKEFTPFLTKGNELEMTFISLESGRRRGFNVSVSCYDHSGDASLARIVGGNSSGKGFLELRTRSDNWRRVCKDGFGERMAEVVCGQLGYPAVKKVSYRTKDCISAGQDCIKAPICNDYTFRLEDCSWSSENCSSADAVKVECYEPGYKGCYDLEDLPQQNGFIFESTSQCVSSCRVFSRKALAIMNGKQCSCSFADEVNLSDITPATCNQPTQDTQRVINSLVYDVSVGFCDELDDVMNGSWGSNITWFGSIVYLTCDDGYSLNGNRTLQCVPGLSPYYPIWNSSLPTCDMLKDTSTSSASDTPYPDDNLDKDPEKKMRGVSYFFLFLFIPIIGVILLAVFLMTRDGKKSLSRKQNVRNRARESLFIGGRLPREPSGTRQQPSCDRSANQNVVTMNAEDSLINTTHFNDGKSQPHIFQTPAQHAQDNIDSSQPSNTTITPFPSLQLPIPHRENPYQMEESESDAYYSAMGSGVSNKNNTMQINTHIGRDENTYEAENCQENVLDQKQASDYRAETRSMSNRPLPHRPISYGVHEGPSLPPRRNLETRPLNMGQNTCTRFDDTCPRPRICALDYTTLPNDDPLGMSVTSKTHTLHHNISSHDKDQTPGKGTRAQKGAW